MLFQINLIFVSTFISERTFKDVTEKKSGKSGDDVDEVGDEMVGVRQDIKDLSEALWSVVKGKGKGGWQGGAESKRG